MLNLLRGDGSLFNPPAIAPMLLYSFSIGARMRAISGNKGVMRAASADAPSATKSSLKSPSSGDDDGGFNANLRAAPCEAFGGAFTLAVVIAGYDEAGNAGRRREGAETSG